MIEDDLKQIKIELMQDEWDKGLVYLWKNHSNFYTGTTLRKFLTNNNVKIDFLKNLKRVPRFKFHNKTTISRYIAAYLPKLSDALWSNKSEDYIFKIIKKIDTLDKPIDFKKGSKENREFIKSSKEADAEKISHILVRSQRESSSEYHWSKQK